MLLRSCHPSTFLQAGTEFDPHNCFKQIVNLDFLVVTAGNESVSVDTSLAQRLLSFRLTMFSKTPFAGGIQTAIH